MFRRTENTYLIGKPSRSILSNLAIRAQLERIWNIALCCPLEVSTLVMASDCRAGRTIR